MASQSWKHCTYKRGCLGSSIQHFGELLILFLPFIYGEFIVHHRICPNVDRCCTAKFVAHGLPAYLLKHGTAIDRLQLKQVPNKQDIPSSRVHQTVLPSLKCMYARLRLETIETSSSNIILRLHRVLHITF